jgi:anti-anti-sigma factor
MPGEDDMSAIGSFGVERLDSTVVVTPLRDLTELGSDELLECDPGGVLELLSTRQARNVIFNLEHIDRCCSSAVGLFIKIWKRAQANDGHVAFCNLSAHLQQIVEILHLNELWPIYGSLAEAMAHVEKYGEAG